MNRWNALLQLFLARLREFYREPEVIFWVYGFPVLLAVGLGIAIRPKEPTPPDVDIQEVQERATEVTLLRDRLKQDDLNVEVHPEDACRRRLRTGKTALYIVFTPEGVEYVYDPAREESLLARHRVDAVVMRCRAGVHVENNKQSDGISVQRLSAGTAQWQTTDARMTDPGNRYIDFLLPGLMGMNIMGGGLWGVGFVIVDLRVRKLLKRLLATPMRREDFLLAILTARLVFLLPEMLILLLLGWLAYGVPMQGNLLTMFLVILVGAAAFSGIGLLVASRANKTETVSGLMNLVMLPMWLLSGIFFSSKRFPDMAQPILQALPLTQLNDALREVMLEGASFGSISWRLAILAVYAVVCFLLGLKLFRWQ